MARPVISDPLRNFKFHVLIPDVTTSSGVASLSRMAFMQVSGLAAQTEPIIYREGGMMATPRKMPGQTDFPPLVLTHGTFADQYAAWFWMKTIFAASAGSGGAWGYATPGNDFRKDIFIYILEHPVNSQPPGGGFPLGPPTSTVVDLSTAKVAYKLYNCWIQGLAYSELDAQANSVYIETMTLMYEGFDIKWNQGVLLW